MGAPTVFIIQPLVSATLVRSGVGRYNRILLYLVEKSEPDDVTRCRLGQADIPADVYEEWRHTYHRAATAMHAREQKLAEAADLIENNLVLLGATAVEDKLQDGVPQTIQVPNSSDLFDPL